LTICTAAALTTGALLPGSTARILFLSAALPAFGVLGWRRLLGPEERAGLRRFIRRSGARADATGALP
jgi:hypothetical protein